MFDKFFENCDKEEIEKRVKSIDNRGNTMLMHSIATSNVEISRHLMEKGSDVNFFFLFHKKGTSVFKKKYVVKKVNFMLEGETPLIRAILNNNSDMIELLLSHPKIDPNLYSKETGVMGKKMPPLHWMIVVTKNPFLVNLICKKGADVEASIDFGMRAIHLAVEVSSSEIVSCLLENGANIEAKMFENQHNLLGWGDTALHRAIELEEYEISHFLVGKGADINALNNYGRSTVMLASERDNFSIIKLLLDHKVTTLKVRALNSLNALETCCSSKCYNYLLNYQN